MKHGLTAALLCLLCIRPAVAADTPPRIISVGGALTEIVYALDSADSLVGVDTTSLFPEVATQLPQVGYQRRLSAEGVLSLRPDVILMTSEAGPKTVLEQIKATGVKLVELPAGHSADGVAQKIRGVANAIGKSAQGEAMANKLLADLKAVQQSQAGMKPSKVVFLMSMGQGSPKAAGQQTAADEMIRLAGGINAFAETHQGYKAISTEAMVAAQPDAILLTQDAIDTIGGIDQVVELPGIALTPAGKHKRILAMSGLDLLGFGPRLPQAVAELQQLLQTE
ncbi:heme/hemin ABC transporter substrate-binding protein [Leucothrix mucor]|uniref:heme/hemin ABC transporter substrate-binding protein n=1 Tax=Leucothrix mucor TaxID=45248 RepID=UPI0003B52C65|nr:ABC transporter substrate-binding protein [Leucothrix mucor]